MFSLDLQEWGSPLQKVLRAQPIPQGSEVLIKLKYCGVCHSDVHIRDGYFELGSGNLDASTYRRNPGVNDEGVRNTPESHGN